MRIRSSPILSVWITSLGVAWGIFLPVQSDVSKPFCFPRRVFIWHTTWWRTIGFLSGATCYRKGGSLSQERAAVSSLAHFCSRQIFCQIWWRIWGCSQGCCGRIDGIKGGNNYGRGMGGSPHQNTNVAVADASFGTPCADGEDIDMEAGMITS